MRVPTLWTASTVATTIVAGGNKKMFVRFCLAAAALIAAVTPASAQDFPNRTIHIVVAYAPGGTAISRATMSPVPPGA